MASKSARRRGELLRAVFGVLVEHPDGFPARDVLKEVERRIELTDAEQGDFEKAPGVRRFEFRVRFATIPVVKAGWLVKRKGEWSLTSDGREAYQEYPDPSDFERAARLLYRQWADSREPDTEDEDEAADSELISAEATLEEAGEKAWREIEAYLTSLPPYDFQNLVAALLGGMGYHVAWVAPPGKDGGMDIVAHTDPLGAQGPRIKVQVKRQQGKVHVDGLRSFLAVLGDQDIGIFVCTGGFTKDAEWEARQQEKRRITLVDLEKLFDLWVEHYDDIDDAERLLLPLRPIYYLAPSD